MALAFLHVWGNDSRPYVIIPSNPDGANALFNQLFLLIRIDNGMSGWNYRFVIISRRST